MSGSCGRLFVWGRNSRLDTDTEVLTPTPIPQFFNIKVKSVSSSSQFTGVLTEGGKVYTIGSQSWFNADEDASSTTVKHWKELSDKKITQICCGSNFMAALSSTGDLYTWGTGTFGQLGQSAQKVKTYDDFKIPSPLKVDSLQGISHIACGDECMAVLTSNGQVWTWGKGYCGALGLGDKKDHYLPQQVTFPQEDEKIVHIRCGASHMAAINEIGEIYTWGNNYLGPLGRILAKGKENDPTPQIIELVQVGAVVSEENLKGSDEFEFTQVECLKYNTVAMTKDGQLYSCGKGGSDGGGHGDQPHTLICLLESAEKLKTNRISSGRYSHIGAIVKADRKHAIYMWGNGEDGRLGFGDVQPQLHPKLLLEGRECYDLSCGETHSAAILEPLDSDVNPNPELAFEAETNVSSAPVEQPKPVEPVVIAEPTPEPVKVEPTTVEPVAEPTPVVEPEPAKIEPVETKPEEPKVEKSEASLDESSTESDDTSTTSDDTEDEPAEPTKPVEEPKPTEEPKTKTPEPTSPIAEAVSPSTGKPKLTIETIDSESEKNFLKGTTGTTTEAPKPIETTKQETGKQAINDVSGILFKKGDKGIVKLWRKRHFKMNMTSIEYYEKEGEGKKGIIKLSDILDILPGTGKLEFNLVSRTGRIYELRANDETSFKEWSTGLRQRLRAV